MNARQKRFEQVFTKLSRIYETLRGTPESLLPPKRVGIPPEGAGKREEGRGSADLAPELIPLEIEVLRGARKLLVEGVGTWERRVVELGAGRMALAGGATEGVTLER